MVLLRDPKFSEDYSKNGAIWLKFRDKIMKMEWTIPIVGPILLPKRSITHVNAAKWACADAITPAISWSWSTFQGSEVPSWFLRDGGIVP